MPNAQDINTPSRHELYTLEDGEPLVEVTEDTKVPNAATFRINKQDHTLANMLRGQLLQTPNVLFAGYKVPHPLHPYFLLKVQTDGTQTPQEALENVCTSLIATIGDLESKFKMEFQVKSVDMAGGVAAPSGTDDTYLGSGWNAGGGYADY